MSILVETSNVKFYTGINSTTYDDLISTYEPMILDDIVNYTHNYFLQSTRYHYDNTISFLSTGAIFCTNTSIDLTQFVMTGSIIHVSGSKFNDGYYQCSSGVYSSYINLKGLVNQENVSTGTFVLIEKVQYPKDLQLIAARMIKHIITTMDSNNVQSESLGDHSISYENIGNNNYPASIINGLKKYRKVRFL